MGAFTEIAILLIQTGLGLYLMAVVLRFILQLVRADFYNPLSQFLVKATNPLLMPLRRVIPGILGIDLAALVLALAIQMLAIVLTVLLYGADLPNILLLLAWSLLGLAGTVVQFYFFAMIVMIIVSWVAPGSHNPAIALLRQITEPVMAPFRKLLPPMGGLDLSPILVFVAINILQIMLRHMATAVSLHPTLVMGL